MISGPKATLMCWSNSKSRHNDGITLQQMRDHVVEAVALAKGRAGADVETDRIFFLALLKLVEIVGEAATRISDPMQAAHPEIPWRELKCCS